ncbi:MAG: hypothetical protein RLZZ283_533 [Candidatus Parcubacteria bacterium]|jgi:hypothetical protein
MSFEDDHEVREIPKGLRARRQSAQLAYNRIKTEGGERDRRMLLDLLSIPEHDRSAITGVLSIGDDRYLIYRE